jgi:hypothetical protein
MNLQQFLSEKAKNSATGFSIEGRAKAKTVLFGTEKLQETPAEFLFYRFFQVLFQVATALLLGYGFFSFFQEPLTTAYPAQGYVAAVVVSSLFVVGYEIAKFFALRRGLRHLIYAIRKDWTFIGSAFLPLIVGIALCYGSWLGANKGAEHIAAEKTDLAPVIQQDVKEATTSAENKYEADKKALTTEHNTNISQARKALASYQSSGKWQNPKTVQDLTASVEAAKKTKEKELSELELAHKGTTAKIEADAAPKLEENSSKQSLYQECIFFGSIFLEWGVVVLIFLIMRSIHGAEDFTPKPSTPQPIEEPITAPTPQNPIPPKNDNSEDFQIHGIAKIAIKSLQNRLKLATEQNDNAAKNAALQGLQTYMDMGYDINTGDFIGKATPPPVNPTPIVTPQAGAKTDNAAKDIWKVKTNNRRSYKNKFQEHFTNGRFKYEVLVKAWEANEDALFEACTELGFAYEEIEMPKKKDFIAVT